MNTIKSVVIDGNDTYEYMKSVLNNESVEQIEFRYCDMTNEDIIKLSNYKKYIKISFINCNFEDVSFVKKIKTQSLSFIDSNIDNYDFISEVNNLKALTVIGNTIDMSLVKNPEKLLYLRLSGSMVYHIDKINLENLKYLFIDETNIDSLDFVKKLSHLKLLCISTVQEENNFEVISSIENRVKIINDIIEIGEITND